MWWVLVFRRKQGSAKVVVCGGCYSSEGGREVPKCDGWCVLVFRRRQGSAKVVVCCGFF